MLGSIFKFKMSKLVHVFLGSSSTDNPSSELSIETTYIYFLKEYISYVQKEIINPICSTSVLALF